MTAECLSQLPDPGPLAYGEYQVLLQLFPEQCVAQGMWLLSACQGNEVPSPLSCLPWSWPNAVCVCVKWLLSFQEAQPAGECIPSINSSRLSGGQFSVAQLPSVITPSWQLVLDSPHCPWSVNFEVKVPTATSMVSQRQRVPDSKCYFI